MKIQLSLQEKWVRRAAGKPRNSGIGREAIREKLRKHRELCAWSGAHLHFNVKHGTAIGGKKKKPCHPLYATIEHSEPGSLKHGFEIVCYHLNDIKGQLPHDCFVELKNCPSWIERMKKWKECAERDPVDENALRSVIKSNAR